MTSVLVSVKIPRSYLIKRSTLQAKIEKLKVRNSSLVREESTAKTSRFPCELQKEKMPKHVALITDGNSRWARSRGLPTSVGHQACYNALKDIVRLSCDWGIKALSVFAFSYENWHRPKAEIDFLMTLFEIALRENLTELLKEDVRVCIIGDRTKLPKSLQKLAEEVTESTKNNSTLDLVVALGYSGRKDIVRACRRIAEKVKEGVLEPEEVTQVVLQAELETNCISEFPDPDLLIRTGGDLRLSDFLLLQSAYSELYFADAFWPDFKEKDYVQALAAFQKRHRTFGKRL